MSRKIRYVRKTIYDVLGYTQQREIILRDSGRLPKASSMFIVVNTISIKITSTTLWLQLGMAISLSLSGCASIYEDYNVLVFMQIIIV